MSYVVGGHVDYHYPVGTVAMQDGAVNASSDAFAITIEGAGGHGARPHEALDTVVVGAHVVTALQTIASRVIDPASPVVVTVGSFHAGTKGNIIAGTAELAGTLRTRAPDARARARTAVDAIATGVAASFGATAVVTWDEPGTPPVVNCARLASAIRDVLAAAPWLDAVTPSMGYVNMGAEDFGCYGERVPVAFARYGCAASADAVAARPLA